MKIKIEVRDSGIYVVGILDFNAAAERVDTEDQIPAAIAKIEERLNFLKVESDRLQAKYGRA